jgi:hypothetical protein
VRSMVGSSTGAAALAAGGGPLARRPRVREDADKEGKPRPSNQARASSPKRVLGQDADMTTDSVFAIASTTKAIIWAGTDSTS